MRIISAVQLSNTTALLHIRWENLKKYFCQQKSFVCWCRPLINDKLPNYTPPSGGRMPYLTLAFLKYPYHTTNLGFTWVRSVLRRLLPDKQPVYYQSVIKANRQIARLWPTFYVCACRPVCVCVCDNAICSGGIGTVVALALWMLIL